MAIYENISGVDLFIGCNGLYLQTDCADEVSLVMDGARFPTGSSAQDSASVSCACQNGRAQEMHGIFHSSFCQHFAWLRDKQPTDLSLSLLQNTLERMELSNSLGWAGICHNEKYHFHPCHSLPDNTVTSHSLSKYSALFTQFSSSAQLFSWMRQSSPSSQSLSPCWSASVRVQNPRHSRGCII